MSPRRVASAVAVTAAAALALPAAAPAALLTLDGATLRYTAVPGERNDVTTVQEDASTVRIGDRVGITITASAARACRFAALVEVRCVRSPGFAGLVIRTKDRDDVITAAAAVPTTVFDGPGRDLVRLGAAFLPATSRPAR